MPSKKNGITRRDFLNATALGAGASLLGMPPPGFARPPMGQLPTPGPDWYGYGGIGDYQDCHGNTPDTVSKAHAVRDRQFDTMPSGFVETGELFDVIVVGAGMAGLGAAYHFMENANKSGRCLVLDNHSVFGGVSKQNEFMVNGERLIAPQGANGFSIPDFDNYDAADLVLDVSEDQMQ